jgi:RNA polymerase sigma-70 factor (ECF subfamily)
VLEAADAVTVADRLAEPDLKARLHAAIDGLPVKYRTVVVMHDVEGYTHEEIAATLNVEVGTSKAQLSRARAKLREVLSDFAGEWVS